MEIPTFQPHTLIALAELVKQWNQDPLSHHNSLVITGNSATVIDGTNILFSVQLPTESNDLNQNCPVEVDLNEDPEAVNEETILLPVLSEPLSNEDPGTELETDTVLVELIKDLKEDKQNAPLRERPLLTFGWKDQANEIITRLNQEIRGSQREKQVQTLEACYYLGQLLEEFKSDSKVLEAIKKLFKASLGTRRTYNFWKGAKRIRQVFQDNDPTRLYYTRHLSLNNLTRLSTADFEKLLDPETHGVRS